MNETQDWSDQWQAYKSTGSKAARDELVMAYASLVRAMAGRIQIGLPPSVEFGDLVGYGMLGLLDAMQKFQPEMGVKFETYASTRIRGAMLDGLRAYDWAPRTLRQKARQVTRVIGSLQASLGRNATDAEIARAMEMSVAEFERLLMELNGLALISLYQPLDSDDDSSGVLANVLPNVEAENPPAQYEKQELHAALTAAIEALPEREKLIVSLYYHDEMTLKEIGAILSVSESRVCQLHTRALLRLRASLAEGSPAARQSAAGHV